LSRKKVYIDNEGSSNSVKDLLDEDQKKACNIINANYITLLSGIWGTGKTLTAIYYALKKLEERRIERIFISNPGSDIHQLGFLPGTVSEKCEPLMMPMIRSIEKLIGKTQSDYYRDKGIIQIVPFQYMRGFNMENSVAICDECQNMEFNDFKTITTRLCKGSKLIFCGDIAQMDISKSKSGLARFMKFEDKEFAICELTNNHRAPIVERLSKFFAEEENKKAS
jgi:phosphate starvation-inducible protein PhoH